MLDGSSQKYNMYITLSDGGNPFLFLDDSIYHGSLLDFVISQTENKENCIDKSKWGGYEREKIYLNHLPPKQV